jgi:hypothetical protein
MPRQYFGRTVVEKVYRGKASTTLHGVDTIRLLKAVAQAVAKGEIAVDLTVHGDGITITK